MKKAPLVINPKPSAALTQVNKEIKTLLAELGVKQLEKARIIALAWVVVDEEEPTISKVKK